LKVYIGVSCDGCGKSNFEGIRYKCTVCSNFDYCDSCEDKNALSHNHTFIKIRDPQISLPRKPRHHFKNNKKCPKIECYLVKNEEPIIEEDIKVESILNNCEIDSLVHNECINKYDTEINYLTKDLGFGEKLSSNELISLLNEYKGDLQLVVSKLLDSQ